MTDVVDNADIFNADSVEGIFANLKKRSPKIVRVIVCWYDVDNHYGVAATPFPAKLELFGLMEGARQILHDYFEE